MHEMVWIVGEADDHVEAAFSTVEAAYAYLERRRDSEYWWVEGVPLDPSNPPASDALRGLGGLGGAPRAR